MSIEWKPIENHPGYWVSNTGVVISESRVIVMKNGVTRTVAGKVLKPTKAGYGYLMVHLGNNKREYVHRMVATAFLGYPPKGCEVNHKDENKLNNNAENLEWVTRSQNLQHGTRFERSQAGNRKRSRTVVAIDAGRVVAKYQSLREADRAGFCRTQVARCCNGEIETVGGFGWRYAEEIIEKAGELDAAR